MVGKARSIEETCERLPAGIHERILATTNNATTIMVALAITGILFSAALAYLITRNISKTLAALIGEVKRLSQGGHGGKLQTRGNPDLVASNSGRSSRASTRRSTP